MIPFALVIAFALAAPQANSLLQPRKNYVACLTKFQKSSLREKMEPAAFTTAVKTACPVESGTLKKALVDYDVAMGVKRAEANSNAQFDLEGYTSNMEESYKDYFESGARPD
jgi:hypothetical protein